MAKIALSKLKIEKNNAAVPFQIGDQTLVIAQYLPLEEKVQMIQDIVNLCMDEQRGYCNWVQVNAALKTSVVLTYANIAATEKQKEDLYKLYDILFSTGVGDKIIATIPEAEYKFIEDGVNRMVEEMYNYRNSAAGILDIITKNYDNLNFDAEKIKNDLADPNNLSLLKDITEKLG